MPSKIKEGDRFGRLVAKSSFVVNQARVWHCVCDCGGEVDVLAGNLMKGNTRSCGCLVASHNRDMNVLIQRSMNIKKKKGYVGIYHRKNGSWQAMITVHKKQIYLGTFDTQEKAMEARERAEEEYFGAYLEDARVLDAVVAE